MTKIIRTKKYMNDIQTKFQRGRKFDALMHYGGKCICCGEDRLEFLTLDEMNGCRKSYRNKKIKEQIASWLFKNNYPNGYRVLCRNCKKAIEIYGSCPHEKK